MNDRSYLVLWFALAFFAILVAAGAYWHWSAPAPSPTTQPTTRSIADRLSEERQRRMQLRERATTATAPTTGRSPDE